MNGNYKTYLFKVMVEDDSFEDGRQAYRAFCPALEQHGASTWATTREEALRNIQEVIEMIVEELVEEGNALPVAPSAEVQVFSDPRVAVTI